jgi:hypothetical protein
MNRKCLVLSGLIGVALCLSACGNVQPFFLDPKSTLDVEPGYPIIDSTSIADGYPVIISEKPADNFELTIYPEGELPSGDFDVPNPIDGKGAIAGKLFSKTSRYAIPNTKLYLTKAVGENNNEVPPIIVGPSSSDIILQSDESGYFYSNSIEPGKYYLVMNAPPSDWEVGQLSDGTAYLVSVNAGDKINLGLVYIYWP